MTDTERLDFLFGQQQVLLAAMFALIETHPDRRALLMLLDQNAEGALAKLSGMATPEAMVEGVHDMKKRLIDYATSSAARQARG